MKAHAWSIVMVVLTAVTGGMLAFSGVVGVRLLTADSGPAAAFCTKAERAGYECVIAPVAYQAQVVTADDGMGSRSTVLIVSDGHKVLAVIPLQ